MFVVNRCSLPAESPAAYITNLGSQKMMKYRTNDETVQPSHFTLTVVGLVKTAEPRLDIQVPRLDMCSTRHLLVAAPRNRLSSIRMRGKHRTTASCADLFRIHSLSSAQLGIIAHSLDSYENTARSARNVCDNVTKHRSLQRAPPARNIGRDAKLLLDTTACISNEGAKHSTTCALNISIQQCSATTSAELQAIFIWWEPRGNGNVHS